MLNELFSTVFTKDLEVSITEVSTEEILHEI